MSDLPLSGLKVADFCWNAAGPVVTRYLGDHGATVVRVESLAQVDPMRVGPPFAEGKYGINRSGFYSNVNSSKLGISLNLSHPEAIDVAWKLCMWGDVVTENFAPGQMKRWGLDYTTVSKERSDVVYLSSSMQGATGPHSRHPGFGNQAIALAGLTFLTGLPDRDALMPSGAYTDYTSPSFALTALLAALDYRRRTGMGQYIDLAQVETALQFIGPVVMDAAVNGTRYERRGNRDAEACPHGAYPCRGDDVWCVIAITGDDQWSSLVEIMGAPSWATEARFSTTDGRRSCEYELDSYISEWTQGHDAETLVPTLQQRGISAGIALTSEGLHNDPQLKSRGHFVKVEHAEVGISHYESQASKLSATPSQIRSAAPLMGEHSQHVLADILGMNDDQILELVQTGAVE